MAMDSELYVYRLVPSLCTVTHGEDDTPLPTGIVFGLVGLLQRYVAAWDEPQDGTQEEVHASRQLMAATCRGLAALVEALDAQDSAEEGASDEPVVRR
jgi:hypothetical protein